MTLSQIPWDGIERRRDVISERMVNYVIRTTNALTIDHAFALLSDTGISDDVANRVLNEPGGRRSTHVNMQHHANSVRRW